MTLKIVQEQAADELLSTNPFALLCGMLLQQQVPIEVAFSGPAKILERFGSFDPASIESASPEDFAKLCATEPAIHPYPESMSVLIQAVARFIVANYGGVTVSLWETAGSGEHLLSRLMLLPGFSKRQAQMFIALVGKQLGVRPPGWEKAAGQFAQPDVYLSVADVHDAASLERVRSGKGKRGKADRDGDEQHDPKSSRSTTSSKGSVPVKTDEEKAEKAERSGARRTGRKLAAKRAANRGAKKGAAAEPEAAESGRRGGARAGAKRAAVKAKKAAKRAARREARVVDPDAPAKKGGGRSADGRRAKKGGGGGGARARRQAAEGGSAESTSEATTPDDVTAVDASTGQQDSASVPAESGPSEETAAAAAAADTAGESAQGASQQG